MFEVVRRFHVTLLRPLWDGNQFVRLRRNFRRVLFRVKANVTFLLRSFCRDEVFVDKDWAKGSDRHLYAIIHFSLVTKETVY